MHYRSLGIKSKWHWPKNRRISQWNQTEDQDMKHYFYGYLICDKEARNTLRKWDSIFYKWWCSNWIFANTCQSVLHTIQSAHNMAPKGWDFKTWHYLHWTWQIRKEGKSRIVWTQWHKWRMKRMQITWMLRSIVNRISWEWSLMKSIISGINNSLQNRKEFLPTSPPIQEYNSNV